MIVAAFTTASIAFGCGDDEDDGDARENAGSSGMLQRGGGSGAPQGGTNAGTSSGGAGTSSGGDNDGGSVPIGGIAGGGASGAAGAGGMGGMQDEVPLEGDRRIPFTPANDHQFVQFFIEHHEMAVEMAEHVVDRGSRADVRQMASHMIEAQTEELEVLRSVDAELTGIDEPPEIPASPHSDADMTHMATMSGAALDRMFLLDMIPHHAAALPVAHRSVDVLRRAELREMAGRIERAQATEIGEMQEVLVALGETGAGQDMAEASDDRPDFGLVGDRRVPLTPENDVEFVDFFIPHHEMALMMAEHVIDRGEDAQVVAMAESIRTAQTAEIETMESVREMLTGDPDPAPVPADPVMEAEMNQMMSLSGTALDLMFLREMIPHHAAGLPTAHSAKPHLESPALRQLSDDIYRAQAQEIGQMQELLQRIE